MNLSSNRSCRGHIPRFKKTDIPDVTTYGDGHLVRLGLSFPRSSTKKSKVSLLVVALLMVATVMVFAAGSKEPATGTIGAAFHIGVVTGTVSQSEDYLRGAEKLIKRYGKGSDGGMIQHITYPDNFMDQQETTISQVVALADDPLMKAIVMNQSVPGTAEAFKRVREKRTDILLFAGEPHEDPLVIQAAADLAVNSDFISRCYTIIWAAKQLGADTFVHISFPRHMSYETLGLRRQIMEEACKDLGMKFVFETAPDLPSPLMGYPGALGIYLTAEAGNFPAILKKVEESVIAKGGAGRFGTWAFSYGFMVTAGLGEYAKNIIEGKAQKGSLDALYEAFAVYTPGAKWNGASAPLFWDCASLNAGAT